MRAVLLAVVCGVSMVHAGTINQDPYGKEQAESYRPVESYRTAEDKNPDHERRYTGHQQEADHERRYTGHQQEADHERRYTGHQQEGMRAMPPPAHGGMFPPNFHGHLPPPPPMQYGPPPPPPEVIIKEIISTYCPNPVLQTCLVESLQISDRMRTLDYAETISLNQLLIRVMQATNVIDIGCFTGANSLAAALVLPKDGTVFALDESENFTNKASKYWKEAGVMDKITLLVNDVVASLKYTLDAGKAGKFDFAFIDHDLINYDQYYELTLQLLRRGGMIAFDNRLRRPAHDKKVAEVLKALNEKLAKDKRVTVYDYNIGEGLTLVFKN